MYGKQLYSLNQNKAPYYYWQLISVTILLKPIG